MSRTLSLVVLMRLAVVACVCLFVGIISLFIIIIKIMFTKIHSEHAHNDSHMGVCGS